MKAIAEMRINGMVERRPSASAIPIGIEATMPVTEMTSVMRSPPQSLVSTIGSPPRSSPMTAITRAMPAKVATQVRNGRRLRPKKNVSADTTTAVIAKSTQSGWPLACIRSRSQTSGQSR